MSFSGVYMCTDGDVNAKDSFGWTAMHKAAENGHLEVVHALRGAGTWGRRAAAAVVVLWIVCVNVCRGVRVYRQ